MKRVFFIIGFFVAAVLFVLVQAYAPLRFGANAKAEDNMLEVRAKSSYLIEVNTGTVLHSHNESKKLPMASMTKMMTLKILFNEIEKGRFAEDDHVPVSENAAAQEGSQAFLDSGKKYLLSDLIKSTIIASANDSAVAIAEYVSGSELEFVKLMNEECKKMGLSGTHFSNSTGLPAADHYSTAADMAKLAAQVVEDSNYKKYSKTYLDELIHESGRKTQLVNTNRSLKNYIGFEGGKTGHTKEAGYCMAAVAKRGDMVLVAVVMGEESSKVRSDDITKLFDYGFNNFKTEEIISLDEPVGEIEVENGENKTIDIFAKESFVVFMNKTDIFEYEIEKDIQKNKAPITKGETIGFVRVFNDEKLIFETELIAGEQSSHIGIWKTYKTIVEKF